MSPSLPPDDANAESRADAQRRQLQRVADALAWSLDPRAVAAQLLDAACAALGAPRGWVAARSEDDSEAMVLASRGYEDGTLEPWMHVPIGRDVPMTTVIRTGRAVHFASAEERARDYPELGRSAAGRAVQASIVVPMVFEGSTSGALGLA
ncbi:MAG TPA: GAF domain-containing protein, partial [Candidatus Limnocylindrales bacterium]